MRIVTDTSVLAKVFVPEAESNISVEIMSAIHSGRVEAHVPALVCYELQNTLTKGLESAEEAEPHLRDFYALLASGLVTEHRPSIELALLANEITFLDTKGHGHISAYDANFHALAIILGATFVTADKAHVRRTEDKIGSVVLLSNFVIPV